MTQVFSTPLVLAKSSTTDINSPPRLATVPVQRYGWQETYTGSLCPLLDDIYLELIMYRWRWSKEKYVTVKINAAARDSRRDVAKNELAIMELT